MRIFTGKKVKATNIFLLNREESHNAMFRDAFKKPPLQSRGSQDSFRQNGTCIRPTSSFEDAQALFDKIYLPHQLQPTTPPDGSSLQPQNEARSIRSGLLRI